MINFVNITKKFNNKIVLNKVNFSIKKGSIHSFIGPNGAGKTTLIKILMRANECNQGKILFNNKEINSYSEFNQKIGFVLDLGRFSYDYKVEYYLKLVANIKNVSLKVLEERLNDSGLNNFRNIKCSELSNG
jgi:ABC-type multidrug transport system ATPase subunit